MSDNRGANNQQCKIKRTFATKNDKNMKRYSENEKTLLYELFERHQEIIDIKLRRNLYSSTKQCEVRECWELILKTFNEHPHTSERTMKQLQKFWLNAKLRRMFPYDKSKSEINPRRTSSDSKTVTKNKQSPRNENTENNENTDSDNPHQDDVIEPRQNCENEEKPQIFNIKYVVPSNLIIREHQPQQTRESVANFHENSKDIIDTPTNRRTNESEHDDTDQHMQDDLDDVAEEHDNSLSISNQDKIESLRLQEMENRVCESQLRCEVQRLIVSKSEEEFKHLQEMNKIRLQEAKIRLKMLERNCSNGRGNMDLFDGV